jgi:hypothetical protein
LTLARTSAKIHSDAERTTDRERPEARDEDRTMDAKTFVRRDHTETKPRSYGGITWVADATTPAVIRGRTLFDGVPCLGPNGPAVMFAVPRGLKDYVVAHEAGRPELAEKAAEYIADSDAAFAREHRDHQEYIARLRATPARDPWDDVKAAYERGDVFYGDELAARLEAKGVPAPLAGASPSERAAKAAADDPRTPERLRSKMIAGRKWTDDDDADYVIHGAN